LAIGPLSSSRPKGIFFTTKIHPKTRKKEETKSNNRLFHHREEGKESF
jgi:hypothetical protein